MFTPDIRNTDKTRNSNILKNSKISGMKIVLIKIQLRWVGHLIHKEDTRLPKQLVYGRFKNSFSLLCYQDKLNDNFN